MQRESQKDRTILCKYEPTEPGDYRIEVKWSGENVPGSPFMVMIFDTQEELSRFLQVSVVLRNEEIKQYTGNESFQKVTITFDLKCNKYFHFRVDILPLVT